VKQRAISVVGRALTALAGPAAFALVVPAAASAPEMSEKYTAPLPIAVYVAGAALAVAMSFVFVGLRGRQSGLTGQLPLAVLMVVLTSVTVWSLRRAVIE